MHKTGRSVCEVEKHFKTGLCHKSQNKRDCQHCFHHTCTFDCHFNQRFIFHFGKQNDGGQSARKPAKTSTGAWKCVWKFWKIASQQRNTFGSQFHKFECGIFVSAHLCCGADFHLHTTFKVSWWEGRSS